jgi:hypothetical protein
VCAHPDDGGGEEEQGVEAKGKGQLEVCVVVDPSEQLTAPCVQFPE